MNYTTLSSLKDKLWITDNSSDSKLLLIIEQATNMIDSKIWYNLWKQDIIARVDGTWSNKIYLDHKANNIEYIKLKNESYNYTVDYIDNYIVYLEEKTRKWKKNIEIKYNIWFDTVPSDIEKMSLDLCINLSIDLWISGDNSESLENKNIKTQKLGSLSVTYFWESERESNIKDRFNIAIKQNFDMIISKYKSFKWII
jgi:hypothetical protein